ncbi:MAG TPA: sulfotransferase [Solirubrobacteraceae bacterium]|nr:sulfotransferase [Solirubrobacteraceae bacterium]
MPNTREPQLAVIVGAARSGTTLLRSLLDSHPDIGCPAEAGLPALLSHARRVWATVCASGDPSIIDPQRAPQVDTPAPVIQLPPYAEREIRRVALAVMKSYCQDGEKRIYCDKSLDNGQHLPMIFHVFPGARCIIIVRHVMDTIASGIEASPWGFDAYGYAPFVYASPENTVMALARYWEMQVSLALAWQESNPNTCFRLRYEDLVRHPETTLTEVFRFVDVAPDMSVLARAFGRFNPASGPGDYKLAFTGEITTASIGRGKQVPVAMVPLPLRERLNELLAQLGYSPLTDAWNAEPHAHRSASTEVRSQLTRLMVWRGDGNWEYDIDRVAIVADDDPQLRWTIDPRAGIIRQGDGEVDLVLTGTSEDLARLIRGDENPGVLLRSGRIRSVTAEKEHEPLIHSPRMISSLIEHLTDRSGNGTRVGGRPVKCCDPS